MPLVTETVNCDATFADGTELPEGRSFIEFTLTNEDVDIDGNHVLPAKPRRAALDEDGQATVTLWPNDRGTRGSLYKVAIVIEDERGIASKAKRYSLGLASIEEGGGPYDLSDIVFDGVSPLPTGVIQLRSRLRLLDGTAALPGLSFVDDPDTGIARPGANQIATATGGIFRTILSNSAFQVNVPVTGTAAQANAADDTAGKLLKVGATGAALGADIYHRTSILGTVSQSGGVPTGALIERDSGANGAYVRLADGTQICTHTLTLERVAGNQVNLLWTFPAAFSSAPKVTPTFVSVGYTATPTLRQLTAPDISQTGTTVSRVSIRTIEGISAPAFEVGDTVDVHVVATGKWFE